MRFLLIVIIYSIFFLNLSLFQCGSSEDQTLDDDTHETVEDSDSTKEEPKMTPEEAERKHREEMKRKDANKPPPGKPH